MVYPYSLVKLSASGLNDDPVWPIVSKKAGIMVSVPGIKRVYFTTSRVKGKT
jgi:hypothetical protein